MNIIYTSRKCSVRESLKEFTEKKLKKLDKFFTSDCTVSVLFTLEKENICKTEITTEYIRQYVQYFEKLQFWKR